MRRLGKFGKLIKHYEIARRSYPPEVFRFLKRQLKSKNPIILDLGCGTGISSRQLTKIGTVIGCDPDQIMLKVARRHKSKVKKYILGSAEKLPFKKNTFDVVTAFSAFHWFDNRKSTKEIMRVLKTNGIFFVVNRSGEKSWGKGYRRAIMKGIKKSVASFQVKYNPEKIIKQAGFKNIRVKKWKRVERYSLQGALDYVQSISIWNSVPERRKPEALKVLKKYFEELKKNKRKIERRLTVKVVVGINK